MRLESLAERITEARERLAHGGVLGGEERRALCGCGEERAGLLRGHRPVAFGRDIGPGLERDIEELSLADPHAGLVDELRELEHALGWKPSEALHGQARDRKHAVARVDRTPHTLQTVGR